MLAVVAAAETIRATPASRTLNVRLFDVADLWGRESMERVTCHQREARRREEGGGRRAFLQSARDSAITFVLEGGAR